MPLTLNGTTGIAGVDGTAGTPAAQGSDTNTGVFYGTDTVSISTGGTARVVVNSDGQTVLGAGTASLPAMSTTGDLNTGTFYPAADTIGWTTGGSERARITSTGVLQVGNNAGTGEVFAQNTVKVWGVIKSSDGSLYNSFGVSSSSKTSTGVYQINFSRTLSSSRFGLSGAIYAGAYFIAGGGESTTGTQVRVYNTSGSNADSDTMFMLTGGS